MGVDAVIATRPNGERALPHGASLLVATGLAYSYQGAPAVVDCTLRIAEGCIVALIGSNGAGKTTSVKMVAGALRPRAGHIQLDGEDVTGRPAHDVVNLGITLVPEGRLVFQHMTVLENLLVSARVARARAGRAENLDRVFGLFPRLAERQDQYAGSLSGGEQQMLAIGRGLMTKPRLMILDEPSLGLSPKLVKTVFALIRTLNREGISVLLVEQNVRQALAVADYAYVLEKGRTVREGSGRQLLHDPAVKEAFLGLA